MAESATQLHARLKEKFGDGVGELVAAHSPFILVKPESLRAVSLDLRDSGFDSLMCLSGVDTQGIKAGTELAPPDAAKTWKAPIPPLELWVVYHLGSTSGADKIALKVILDRVAPRVPTVSDIWRVANWHEREAYDMYGIEFTGHPNLVRILCAEDWQGWPLRKDYVFPTHYMSIPHARAASGAEAMEHEDAAHPAADKTTEGGHGA